MSEHDQTRASFGRRLGEGLDASAEGRPGVETFTPALCRGEKEQWHATVLTLFPDMFPGALGLSLAGRALENGIWSLDVRDIRSAATDRHRTVDDTPFGGGAGMVMRPDVLDAAIGVPDGRPLIYLSPRGAPLTQFRARSLADGPGVTLICGRYEGIDQRILDQRNVEEISIGDYVLSGGELPALVLLDACIRLLPGVMGAAASWSTPISPARPSGRAGRSQKSFSAATTRRLPPGAGPRRKRSPAHAGPTCGAHAWTVRHPRRNSIKQRDTSMNIIQTLEAEQIAKLTAVRAVPEFRAGDTLKVMVRVVEGERTRIQAYEGVCIARSNKGISSNFTVRKISYGEGVERVFPLYAPTIAEIQVMRRGDVRRAKLYYLRGRSGKSARIAERARDMREVVAPVVATPAAAPTPEAPATAE